MRISMAIPVLLAGAALAAPVQAAEDERPQPGCAGVNFTDARGDVENPGLDVVSGFLTTDGREVFANLVVANLDRTVDQEGMVEEYFVAGYRVGDESDSVAAHLHADGSTDGGRFFEGRDGIVQMKLPGVRPDASVKLWAHSGADGEPITVPLGESGSASAYLFGHSAEEIEGREQATACAAPAAAPAADDEEPAAGEPAGRRAASPALEILSTRARGRALRVTVRGTATGVRATLSRGGRVVARGGVASLDGRVTFTLTARRALRAGTYTLRVGALAPRAVRVT